MSSVSLRYDMYWFLLVFDKRRRIFVRFEKVRLSFLYLSFRFLEPACESKSDSRRDELEELSLEHSDEDEEVDEDDDEEEDEEDEDDEEYDADKEDEEEDIGAESNEGEERECENSGLFSN